MTAITWFPSDRTHREQLKQFACTPPAPTTRSAYPQPWGQAVQTYIRTTKTPARSPKVIELGMRTHVLAAVIAYTYKGVVENTAVVNADMAAISLTEQAARNGDARAATRTHLIKQCAKLGSCHADFVIIRALVDRRNVAALRFLKDPEMPFTYAGPASVGTHLDQWSLEVDPR